MWVLALTATVLVNLQPSAGSSGIPEVISYINGVKVPDNVSLQSFFVKTVGILLAVPSGLCLGPEGPAIALSAASGFQILLILRCVFPGSSVLRALRNDRDERVLLLVGAAIGIACAFRAPIAGVMFAVEELPYFSSRLIFPLYLAGTVTYYILSVLYHGRVLPAAQGFTEFRVFEQCLLDTFIEDVVLYALLGVLGGLLGSLFNAISVRINRMRRQYINAFGWRRLLETACIGLLTTIIMFWSPIHYGCTDASALIRHMDETIIAGQREQSTFESSSVCLADEVWDIFRLQNGTKPQGLQQLLDNSYLDSSLCDSEGEYNELESLMVGNLPVHFHAIPDCSFLLSLFHCFFFLK